MENRQLAVYFRCLCIDRRGPCRAAVRTSGNSNQAVSAGIPHELKQVSAVQFNDLALCELLIEIRIL